MQFVRLLSVIAVAALMTSLSGCGGGDRTGSADTTELQQNQQQLMQKSMGQMMQPTQGADGGQMPEQMSSEMMQEMQKMQQGMTPQSKASPPKK